jgi:hypothetical protein
LPAWSVARGPAAADQVGAIVELLQAQPAVEGTQHGPERGRARRGEQHLERARLHRQSHADSREKRRAPRARRHDRHVAGLARAVATLDAHHPAPLDHERARLRALLDPRTEPPSGMGERLRRGQGLGLAIDRRVHAAQAGRRDAGRERGCGLRVHDLDRHSIGALLRHPGPRRAPGGLIERQPQATGTPVAGRRLQLALESGPAREARERERPLGGVAPHRPHAGRAGPGGGGPDAGALQHGDARAGIGAS